MSKGRDDDELLESVIEVFLVVVEWGVLGLFGFFELLNWRWRLVFLLKENIRCFVLLSGGFRLCI